MSIVHTTLSCALAWKSYQPRETMRSHGGETGRHPVNSEELSSEKSNLIRLRYANRQWSTFHRCVKPAIDGEECAYASIGLTGVVEEGASG